MPFGSDGAGERAMTSSTAANLWHLRAIRAALRSEGFVIVNEWCGRHFRITIERCGTRTTLTVSSSPRVPEETIRNTLNAARKGCPMPKLRDVLDRSAAP